MILRERILIHCTTYYPGVCKVDMGTPCHSYLPPRASQAPVWARLVVGGWVIHTTTALYINEMKELSVHPADGHWCMSGHYGWSDWGTLGYIVADDSHDQPTHLSVCLLPYPPASRNVVLPLFTCTTNQYINYWGNSYGQYVIITGYAAAASPPSRQL